MAVQASARQQARARRGGGRGGTQLLEQQLQQHIDREDCRIKNLTEAVLYDFLPCAIRAASANTPEPISELTEDRCWVSDHKHTLSI